MNKIYDLLEKKLEMDIENVVIGQVNQTGKKIRMDGVAYSSSVSILQGQHEYFKEL